MSYDCGFMFKMDRFIQEMALKVVIRLC